VTPSLNDSLVIFWVLPLLQNQMRVRAGNTIGKGPAWGEALKVISLPASLHIPNSRTPNASRIVTAIEDSRVEMRRNQNVFHNWIAPYASRV
jgi:hypothetical protein